jgi:hypothetical protein
MANGAGAGGATAPYPSNGYPGVNFFGPGIPGRQGFASGTNKSGMGGGMGARSAINQVLPAAATKNHLIAIAIVMILGYGLWHYSSTL